MSLDLLTDPTIEDHLPLSINDALQSSEGEQWFNAIQEELQAHALAKTWCLVLQPDHHNTVSSKWLLKKKYNPDGSINRFKACLVVCGFSQRYGVDYFDMYSPVLGMASFRMLIAIAAKFNLPLHHLDVKIAFLHGHLYEEVYMTQPPHFAHLQYPHYVYYNIYIW
ncbi:hypothetical protein L7F22_000305 [Adiantum nelumboides]|nr:hypothetical protein [Adiantum nelumboides]